MVAAIWLRLKPLPRNSLALGTSTVDLRPQCWPFAMRWRTAHDVRSLIRSLSNLGHGSDYREHASSDACSRVEALCMRDKSNAEAFKFLKGSYEMRN